MPTETLRLIDNHLSFQSNNPEKLLPALRLIFGDPAVYICITTDENGFHIAWDADDGRAFIPDAQWFHHDRPRDHLPRIVEEIQTWLGYLTHKQAYEMIHRSNPTEEAYSADPGIDLTGYSVTLHRRTRGGVHSMVTVTPAWV